MGLFACRSILYLSWLALCCMGLTSANRFLSLPGQVVAMWAQPMRSSEGQEGRKGQGSILILSALGGASNSNGLAPAAARKAVLLPVAIGFCFLSPRLGMTFCSHWSKLLWVSVTCVANSLLHTLAAIRAWLIHRMWLDTLSFNVD